MEIRLAHIEHIHECTEHILEHAKNKFFGRVSEASAFGSGHDLRVLGLSPVLGFLLSRESASASFSITPAHALSLMCSQINE